VKCGVCGIYETETPDWCNFCYDSITNYKILRRYIANIEDDRLSVQLTGLLDHLSGFSLDSEKVTHSDNSMGQWCPKLAHAPYGVDGAFAYPGGLLEFTATVIARMKASCADTLKDSDIVSCAILSLLHHGIGYYSYTDYKSDNTAGQHFRICRPRPLIVGKLATLYHAMHLGLSLSEDVMDAVFYDESNSALRKSFESARLLVEFEGLTQRAGKWYFQE
jgi:hypothetical protein